MSSYKHIVKYYETDRMGYTHHSNYIRWMEEARIDFMEKMGWSYQKFEEEGIISPVTGIECKYKHSTTFPDEVDIEASVESFRGVKLRLKYVMKNQNNKVVCTGTSEHCFTDKEGKIIRIDREYPDFYELLCSMAET